MYIYIVQGDGNLTGPIVYPIHRRVGQVHISEFKNQE